MGQLPLDWSFPTSYASEDFVVTDSNRLAHAQLTEWAPSNAANALLLTGPEASGKTHLAHIWAQSHEATFLRGDALHTQSSEEWFAYRPTLIIESIEDCRADALFHLLHYLQQTANTHCALLTSRVALNNLWLSPRDIYSRLCALPHAQLTEPDDGLLEALLIKGFSDRQLRVEPNVIQYLIPRMPRDCASLYRLVDALDQAALKEKRAITLPLARNVLGERETL